VTKRVIRAARADGGRRQNRRAARHRQGRRRQPEQAGAGKPRRRATASPRPMLFWRSRLLDLACEKAYDTVRLFLQPATPMPVLTASAARANLYRLIDQTAESHEPILIAGKRSSAVLISAEDWKVIQETMHLLSIPGMRESIRQGIVEPLADSAKRLEW
jgi:prevent-host-death family protein